MVDELLVEPTGGVVLVLLEVQGVSRRGSRPEAPADAEAQADVLEEAEAGAAVCLEPAGRAGLGEAGELQQVPVVRYRLDVEEAAGDLAVIGPGSVGVPAGGEPMTRAVTWQGTATHIRE